MRIGPDGRTPMTDQLKCLDSQGYTDEFVIGNDGLKSIKTGEVFKPEDIEIVEHRRFEGYSDPDDMAILFIIKTKSGLKGTVVDAFGIYGNIDLMEFMNEVESLSQAEGRRKLKECEN